jgi:hypothetical protein
MKTERCPILEHHDSGIISLRKTFSDKQCNDKAVNEETQKISFQESTSTLPADNMIATTPVLLNYCRLIYAQLRFRFDKDIKNWHSNVSWLLSRKSVTWGWAVATTPFTWSRRPHHNPPNPIDTHKNGRITKWSNSAS